MIVILLSVAFLTLIERKLLGYIQFRKGPNKLGIIGVLQPFSDAIKLITKESFYLIKSNYLYYLFSPIFILVLNLMIWIIYPFWRNLIIIRNIFLYLLCCFRLGVYGLLISGWSSNSRYSLLGSLRSLAQSISYEVRLSIIIIRPLTLIDSLNLNLLYKYQEFNKLLYFMWPLALLFLFRLMAELNRTPFDFSEGESELVSGFNVEYRSGGFVLIFLSEYSRILFIRFLFINIFVGINFNNLIFYLLILFIRGLIIWIRGRLPRFRYDLLIYICWLIILPISLNYLFYTIIFKLYL